MNDSLEKVFGWCYPLLRKLGIEYSLASYMSLFINIIIMFLLAYVIFIAFRFVLDKSFRGIAKRTKNKFDDYVIENITGQYLKTNETLGYVITDVSKKYDNEVINELKKIEATIKFRVIY